MGREQNINLPTVDSHLMSNPFMTEVCLSVACFFMMINFFPQAEYGRHQYENHPSNTMRMKGPSHPFHSAGEFWIAILSITERPSTMLSEKFINT